MAVINDLCHQRCDAVWCGRILQTFQRFVLPRLPEYRSDEGSVVETCVTF